jgi:26S proteasome regulatory subunit N1
LSHADRHLAAEAADEYKQRLEAEESTDDLFQLAAEIIPYFMAHNAEADACDLLMEVLSSVVAVRS